MRIHTVKGSCYVLTCTAACRVQAVRPNGGGLLLVLEADKAGQFCFVAPTDAVEVSDEHALVTQTFKGASLGLSAQGGGIGNGQNITLNSLNAATMACSGAATFQSIDVASVASFSSGVTMDQSLSVVGPVTFNGEANFEKVADLNMSAGPNNFFVLHLDAGGVSVERSNVDPAHTLYDGDTSIYNRHDNDARYGRIGTSNTWDGDQTIMGRLAVAGSVNSNMNFIYSVHFESGVTMAQSLNVVGPVTFSGRVVKQSQTVPLVATDTPNCEEGDARWAKFNNTLTDAQYAALPVKDQTTLYITDTGKVYIGNHALN